MKTENFFPILIHLDLSRENENVAKKYYQLVIIQTLKVWIFS